MAFVIRSGHATLDRMIFFMFPPTCLHKKPVTAGTDQYARSSVLSRRPPYALGPCHKSGTIGQCSTSWTGESGILPPRHWSAVTLLEQTKLKISPIHIFQKQQGLVQCQSDQGLTPLGVTVCNLGGHVLFTVYNSPPCALIQLHCLSKG